jgi:tetratricopeptide (TPR) repeat protein
MPSGEEMLQQAVGLCQAGQKHQAAGILISVLKMEPSNELAWWLLSNCVEPPQQKRDCLNRVMRINPNHSGARLFLAMLERDQPLPDVFSAPIQAEPLAAGLDGNAVTRPLTQPLAPLDQEPAIATLMEEARAAEENSHFSTAYEAYEAILQLDSSDTLAWLGKGYAAGRLSTQDQNEIPEFFRCFSRAVLSHDSLGLSFEEAVTRLEPALARATTDRLLKLADFAAQMALAASQPMAKVYAVEHAHLTDWAYAISRGRESQTGPWCSRSRVVGAATNAFQRIIDDACKTNLSTRSRQQIFQTLKDYMLSNLTASGMNKDPELNQKLEEISKKALRKKLF